MLSRRMLSAEEEASAGEEKEVRKEDQDKINLFSRLHSREKIIEGELLIKEKEKEDVEEISNELELADEDDRVPYKIGDTFFFMPLADVQEHLSTSSQKIDDTLDELRTKLNALQDQMRELKTVLYGRFGRSINLEA